MYRRQLEHVILEVGRRNDLEYFYIISSAALLAVLPDPPEGALTATRDVDIIPPFDDDRLADRLSWVLGEGSDFDIEHGYYVQGVSWTTPLYAPKDWHLRALPVRVDRYTGLCMEAHDLALSKLGAGREKDLEFVQDVARLELIQRTTLLERLTAVETTPEHREATHRITGERRTISYSSGRKFLQAQLGGRIFCLAGRG